MEAELVALDIKVDLLNLVAGSALFIAAFLVWPHGWGQWTLLVATFAVVAVLGLLYGVMVNWKTFSLWGKVVVWLVFGMIWAAFAAWLPH